MVVGVMVVFTAVLIGLTALLLAFRARHRRLERRREVLRKSWEPTILAVIRGDVSPGAFPEKVEEGDRRAAIRLLVRFAERMEGDAPEGRRESEPVEPSSEGPRMDASELERLRRLAAPFIDVVLPDLADRFPEIRARAVHTLTLLGSAEHLPAVRAMLHDRSPLVAVTAARALSRLGDPELTAEILGCVDEWRSWNERYLGSILASSNPENLALLRSVLLDPEAPAWRVTVAAYALLLSEDIPAADTAAEVLRSGRFQGREPVAALLRLLPRAGRREHEPVLCHYLESSDEAIRSQAVRALGRLAGDPEERLVAAAADPSPWVAFSAVRTLEERGNRAGLARLVDSGGAAAEFARQVIED